LNGLMMPTTPTGWRSVYTSMPVDTFSEYSPFVYSGIAQASSTTSSPRAISPAASEVTLPCSLVRIAARSPERALSSSRKANITCCRFAMEVSRHPGNARAAACTAASTSSVDAKRTRFCSTPRAGL
jgi:hypothetical protein